MSNESILKSCASCVQTKLGFMNKDFELLGDVSLKTEVAKHELSVLENELIRSLAAKGARAAPLPRPA